MTAHLDLPLGEAADDPGRLSAVADYIAVRPQARGDLDALCELAAMVCDVPTAAVNLIDDRAQHSVAAYGIDPAVCSLDESMCAVSVSGGSDLFVPDARADQRFAANPWVDGRLGGVRMYAAALLRSPEGHAVGTICVFDEHPGELPERRRAALTLLARQAVDVLELQLATLKLHETVAELGRSQEQLGGFAGQLSHDLKTPLTATVGFAELLADRTEELGDETATRYARRCLSSGQRMMAMIDQLLAYARVGGVLDRQPVSLDGVMSAVLEDLGDSDPDVSIIWSGAPVPADPAQLRALLQNLVSNAVKYRRPDEPCTVRITTTETPGGVELAVADNGTGIPPERYDDALTPLRRLRSDVPGSGLGLATCSRIVAAHGGTLHLDETPGGGLTVSAVFPV